MALYLPLVGVVLIGSGLSTAIASAIVALAVVGLIFLLALRHGHLVSRVGGASAPSTIPATR